MTLAGGKVVGHDNRETAIHGQWEVVVNDQAVPETRPQNIRVAEVFAGDERGFWWQPVDQWGIRHPRVAA